MKSNYAARRAGLATVVYVANIFLGGCKSEASPYTSGPCIHADKSRPRIRYGRSPQQHPRPSDAAADKARIPGGRLQSNGFR